MFAKHICLFLVAVFFARWQTMVAQVDTYDVMCQQLSEKSLPLVNLLVDVDALVRSDFVRAEIEITDPQRRTDPHSETVHYACGVRIRGGYAASQEKKFYAIKLYDAEGEDFDAPIFGIRNENSWILDAMAIDRIRMRNRVCFDLWNQISQTPYDTPYNNRNGTAGVFVEVFLNGIYQGLYCCTDKVDRRLLGLKKWRVNEDTGTETVRGILYKGINWLSGSKLAEYKQAPTDQSSWNAWELQYPSDHPSDLTWNPLMALIDFCAFANSDDVFLAGYQDHFYPENLVDYLVFTFALNVGDNAYKNTFLSTPDINRHQRFLITPWDMDMSLGGYYNGNRDPSFVDVDRYAYVAPFNRITSRDIDNLLSRSKERWCQLSQTILSPENVQGLLEGYARLFAESGAWERECSRWNNIPVPLASALSEELDYVIDWYAQNCVHLNQQWGIATDIADLSEPSTLPPAHDAFYSLDGRKLSVPQPARLLSGVYLYGGKKLLVK